MDSVLLKKFIQDINKLSYRIINSIKSVLRTVRDRQASPLPVPTGLSWSILIQKSSEMSQSLDLNVCDSLLFRKVKSRHAGIILQSYKEMKGAIQRLAVPVKFWEQTSRTSCKKPTVMSNWLLTVEGHIFEKPSSISANLRKIVSKFILEIISAAT